MGHFILPNPGALIHVTRALPQGLPVHRITHIALQRLFSQQRLVTKSEHLLVTAQNGLFHNMMIALIFRPPGIEETPLAKSIFFVLLYF